MAKKQKDKSNMLNFDGKEYDINKMTDSQKELVAETKRYENHITDLQNKLQTNVFIREQLVETEKIMVEKHQKNINKLKEVLED
tara:strand:+ start:324 stop:575 length:252 start_codon:yes stop_codon:yes gene_type:complete